MARYNRELPTFLDGVMKGYTFVDNIFSKKRAEEIAEAERKRLHNRQDAQDAIAAQQREIAADHYATQQRRLDDALVESESDESAALKQQGIENAREDRKLDANIESTNSLIAYRKALANKARSAVAAAKAATADRKKLLAGMGQLRAIERMRTAVQAAHDGGYNEQDLQMAESALMGNPIPPDQVDEYRKAVTNVLGPRLKKVVGEKSKFGSPITDVSYAFATEVPRRGFMLHLKLTDKAGHTYTAPLTRDGTSEDGDEIQLFDVEDAGRIIKSREAALEAVKATLDKNGIKYKDITDGLDAYAKKVEDRLYQYGYNGAFDAGKDNYVKLGDGDVLYSVAEQKVVYDGRKQAGAAAGSGTKGKESDAGYSLSEAMEDAKDLLKDNPDFQNQSPVEKATAVRKAADALLNGASKKDIEDAAITRAMGGGAAGGPIGSGSTDVEGLTDFLVNGS